MCRRSPSGRLLDWSRRLTRKTRHAAGRRSRSLRDMSWGRRTCWPLSKAPLLRPKMGPKPEAGMELEAGLRHHGLVNLGRHPVTTLSHPMNHCLKISARAAQGWTRGYPKSHPRAAYREYIKGIHSQNPTKKRDYETTLTSEQSGRWSKLGNPFIPAGWAALS